MVVLPLTREPTPDTDRAEPMERRPNWFRRRLSGIAGQFLWIFSGRAALAVAGWALLVALTKSTDVVEVGRYSLALAIAVPVIFTFRMHLRYVLATDHQREFPIADYTAITAISSVLGIAVALAIANALGASDCLVTVAILSVSLAVESFTDLIYGRFQRADRNDLVGRSMLLRGVATAFTSVGMLIATKSLTAALTAGCVIQLVVLCLHDRPHAHRADCVNGGFDKESNVVGNTWRSRCVLLQRGLPLGLTVLVLALDANVPRHLVEKLQGRAALGLFAAVASLVAIGSMISQGLAQAALPVLSRSFAEGDLRRYHRLVLLCLCPMGVFGIAGVLISAVFGVSLLSWFFTNQYATGHHLLTLLCVFGAISSVSDILGTATLAMRRFWLPLPINTICGLIGLLAGFVLIPLYGLIGAGIALIVSGSVRVFCFGVVVFGTRYLTKVI